MVVHSLITCSLFFVFRFLFFFFCFSFFVFCFFSFSNSVLDIMFPLSNINIINIIINILEHLHLTFNIFRV